MSIPREDGRIAAERGRRNEARVIYAVSILTDEWIGGARFATKAEDHGGIDVVVASDVGELHLQVKSSRRGVQKWLRRNERNGNGHRNRTIGIVHVRADHDDVELARVVRAELLRVRAVFMAR